MKMKAKGTAIREGTGDRIFMTVVRLLMVLVLIVTLYPFVYVLSMSLSDPVSVMKQEVWLLPKGMSLTSYTRVLSEPGIWQAFGNTVFYTVAGTALNLVMTILIAYPLSKRRFWGKNAIMMFVSVTMLFNGGMIPNFLLISSLGLYNSRWALILPGAIGVYNMVLARTFFQGIPISLEESVSIDGGNDWVVLTRIILPISKPILAVLTLFYAVGHWNTYFNALLYLPDLNLQPLQMYLMRLLVQNQQLMAEGGVDALQQAVDAMQTKYATIIVVITPIMCVYPFLQKYFVQGVMIGALKE